MPINQKNFSNIIFFPYRSHPFQFLPVFKQKKRPFILVEDS